MVVGFDAVRRSLDECNRGFRMPLVPYFAPLVAADGRGDPWYLGEDFAFCERARQAGFPVQADTSIRLWHVGSYRYGWEDAGRDVPRFADYTFHQSGADARPAKPVTPRVPPTAGFSEDWFSRHAPVWSELLGHLKGRECHALEVGVFEGRSTVWLLENILAHPASTLTVVDTFAGGAEHAATDLTDLEARFRANTAAHAAKLVVRKGRSETKLRELPLGRYDFVSIDGSHEAADVLSDAVLGWPLVKPGGLVCFDDYEWWIDAAPERSPKLAIDAFLATMRGRCEVVRKGWQVWVRKTD
jgi:predicted O-methyltransferase YrrM